MWRAPLLWLLLGHSLNMHLRRRLLLLLLPSVYLHLHLGQGRPLKGCLSLLLAQLRCQLIQLQLLARASTLQGSAVLVREPMEGKSPQPVLASKVGSVTVSLCGRARAGTETYQRSKGVCICIHAKGLPEMCIQGTDLHKKCPT